SRASPSWYPRRRELSSPARTSRSRKKFASAQLVRAGTDLGSNMSASGSEIAWVPLTPRERRILGVLVEKAKTTPEYYPLTVAAIVTGSNQKSNRDPVTNYDADDVEEVLQDLRRKGAAVMGEAGGRGGGRGEEHPHRP